MTPIIAFACAFGFSFMGSIPPGTLNLTVLQLGLEGRTAVALRFALAAAIMEYPYAWIAVTFEKMILSSEAILQNFQLISAIVLTVLGILNLMSVNKPSKLTERFSQSGFRRGLVLGLLNPLAIPYWIGTTAFMEAQGWIALKSMVDIQSYLVGVVLGAITLLTLVTYLAKRLGQALQHNKRIRMIPGIVLISLGLYAFARMLF